MSDSDPMAPENVVGEIEQYCGGDLTMAPGLQYSRLYAEKERLREAVEQAVEPPTKYNLASRLLVKAEAALAAKDEQIKELEAVKAAGEELAIAVDDYRWSNGKAGEVAKAMSDWNLVHSKWLQATTPEREPATGEGS